MPLRPHALPAGFIAPCLPTSAPQQNPAAPAVKREAFAAMRTAKERETVTASAGSPIALELRAGAVGFVVTILLIIVSLSG
jgi:hypothetical protein